MFENVMKAQLKRVFDLDKVTYDSPGESQEQEAAFIEVGNARTRLIDGRQIARVTGKLHIFASSEKLPYGYFSKCLAEADPADTRNFFFFGFEENKGTYRNIVERSLEFIYLFDSQYDPALGSITSIDLSLVETS